MWQKMVILDFIDFIIILIALSLSCIYLCVSSTANEDLWQKKFGIENSFFPQKGIMLFCLRIRKGIILDFHFYVMKKAWAKDLISLYSDFFLVLNNLVITNTMGLSDFVRYHRRGVRYNREALYIYWKYQC